MIHNAGCTVKTDFKIPLKHADGTFFLLHEKARRICKINVPAVPCIRAGIDRYGGVGGFHVAQLLLHLRTVGHLTILFLDKPYNGRYFLIRYKCALHTHRLWNSLRAEQHVSLAEELLGAVHIQNGSRIHARSHGKGDTARHIRLDQTGNDIDRRTLCRNDQMNAARSCELCQTADGFLDFARRYHHKIRQLVHDNHNLRQLFRLRIALDRRQGFDLRIVAL